MKTTRILSIVMALCLLVTALAVFTACGGNETPADTTPNDTQADTTITTEKTKVNRHVIHTPDFQHYYHIFLQTIQEFTPDDHHNPMARLMENRAQSDVYYIREKETFIYAVELGYRLAMKKMFPPDVDTSP